MLKRPAERVAASFQFVFVSSGFSRTRALPLGSRDSDSDVGASESLPVN